MRTRSIVGLAANRFAPSWILRQPKYVCLVLLAFWVASIPLAGQIRFTPPVDYSLSQRNSGGLSMVAGDDGTKDSGITHQQADAILKELRQIRQLLEKQAPPAGPAFTARTKL